MKNTTTPPPVAIIGVPGVTIPAKTVLELPFIQGNHEQTVTIQTQPREIASTILVCVPVLQCKVPLHHWFPQLRDPVHAPQEYGGIIPNVSRYLADHHPAFLIASELIVRDMLTQFADLNPVGWVRYTVIEAEELPSFLADVSSKENPLQYGTYEECLRDNARSLTDDFDNAANPQYISGGTQGIVRAINPLEARVCTHKYHISAAQLIAESEALQQREVSSPV